MQPDTRTIFAFILSRRDSFNPCRVIHEANRQAMAESAVAEARADPDASGVDFPYTRNGPNTDLEVNSADEETLYSVADTMHGLYGPEAETESREESR